MSAKDTLLEIIKDSPLSDTTRDFFAKKVKREGATQENLTALRELLRAVQHTSAKALGLKPEDEPSVKAASLEMHAKLMTAEDKYAKAMERLEKESERLADDIQNDLKHLEKIVVASAQAEA